MAQSILQKDKVCFVTGSHDGLHKHHIFRGSRRQAAEKWGCWVWLRGDWHNMAAYGVHNNPVLDDELKRKAQHRFEELYGHEKFMQVFGKNYL
jgi:hypothetical protein